MHGLYCPQDFANALAIVIEFLVNELHTPSLRDSTYEWYLGFLNRMKGVYKLNCVFRVNMAD